jgi:hypothetical protein
MVRRRVAPFRTMLRIAGRTRGPWPILRDARNGALLRMRKSKW